MEQLRRKIDQLLANKPNRNTPEYREFKAMISRGYPDDLKKLVKIAALLQIALRTPNSPKDVKPVDGKNKRKKKKAVGKLGQLHERRALEGLSYREFLMSDHWKETKDKAHKLGLYDMCYCCNAKDKKLQLHHTTYKYKGTRKEKKQCIGLVCVCQSCHKSIHDLEKSEKISIKKATQAIKMSFMTK